MSGEAAPLVPKRAGASVGSSVINLSNTILGTGVLAMSSAVKDAGVYCFCAAMLVTVAAAHGAIVLLFRCVARLSDEEEMSYQVLGRLLGPAGERLAFWSVTLQQLGAVTAYVVIIGDVLAPVLPLGRVGVQLAMLVCVITPLCLLRRMDALRHVSGFALASILSLAVAVVLRGAVGLPEHGVGYLSSSSSSHEEVQWAPPSAEGVLRALPVTSFAFLCHQNTFPIWRELEAPTPQKMTAISAASMAICFVAYAGVGLTGYLMFLGDTESDLLLNLDASYTPIRVAFGVATGLSYPLVLWEARENLKGLFFGTGSRAELSTPRHVALNAGIIACTAAVGMAAPNITSVISLVGSTCSPCMMYVLPGMLAARLLKGRSAAAGWALLAYGGVLIPGCVWAWSRSRG